MIHMPHSSGPVDWDGYDLQEAKEPFDAVRKMGEDPPPAGADLDLLILETKVQALARVAKEHAGSLGSGHEEFLRAVKCDIPADAVSYCKRRYGGSVSALLKWHYCLALHVAERGEWLGRAIGLMLESARRTGDERRASSYLVIAHNLNRWHNCGMDDAVAASAVRLARGGKDSQLAHIYARIAACAEKNPETRDGLRDMMIRRAACSDPLAARRFLEAAIQVAEDRGPARLACMRLCERRADGERRAPQRAHGYNEALRHADGRGDRERLAGKVVEAARLAEFADHADVCKEPALEIPGQTGPERAEGLAAVLSCVALPARMIRRDGGGDAAGAAGRGEVAERWAHSLAAYVSAVARACEDDGRISADDHMRCIMSSGPRPGPAGEALIRAGIERHYDGDYASSIHILLPQVESTLRALLGQGGIGAAGGDGQPVRPVPLRSMIEGGAGILGGDLAAFLHVWLAGTDSANLRDRVSHCLYGDGREAGGECALPRELNHGASLALILAIELLSGACPKDRPARRGPAARRAGALGAPGRRRPASVPVPLEGPLGGL